MAKNYTFNEAVEIIAKGTDLEVITDIGRRFPVLAHKVAVVAAKAGEAFVDLMGYMPDYLTANKVNSAIKAGIAESGSDEDEGEENTSEATNEETTEDAGEAKWDESMSAKQLWDILGKAGKRKLAKSTKKADLIEACKKAFGAAEADEAEDVEEDAEETEATNAYEGKSAMELFKECKKRGIKAAAKKPAKFYADLLIKDDEANSESDGEDDWDEEDTSKEENTKSTKKTEKKAEKKSKKAEAEDEDDDWDI